MPAIQRASALVTEVGGITSHAAVVAVSLGIPLIVGVENAVNIIPEGIEISIYPEVGVIYSGRGKVL
ncbi:Pyruvate kinase [compost metagenome]